MSGGAGSDQRETASAQSERGDQVKTALADHINFQADTGPRDGSVDVKHISYFQDAGAPSSAAKRDRSTIGLITSCGDVSR